MQEFGFQVDWISFQVCHRTQKSGKTPEVHLGGLKSRPDRPQKTQQYFEQSLLSRPLVGLVMDKRDLSRPTGGLSRPLLCRVVGRIDLRGLSSGLDRPLLGLLVV